MLILYIKKEIQYELLILHHQFKEKISSNQIKINRYLRFQTFSLLFVT